MKSEIKKGAMMSYILIAITSFIALVYTPILIRYMGQSEYGLYSLIYSMIGYLTILDLGFGNAIIIYTARYREQQNKEAEEKLHGMFSVIFTVIGLIAAIIGITLFFSANNLFSLTMTASELNKAKILLLILTFNLAITFPFLIYSSIITAYEKFIFQKGMAIARVMLMPILMLPLLLLGYRSIAMVLVVTIVNISVILSNYLYCKNKLNIKFKYTGFDKNLFKEIFSYSFFIFLNTIIDKINWSLDQFILGSVSGTIAVAIYAVAAQFNVLYINFSTAINGVLLPKITRIIERNSSDEEVTNEFIKVGRIQYYVLFLIISGFILFGKEFIVWWAGKEYETAYYIGLILMVPVTIPLIQNVGILIMQAKNKHRFRSIVYFGISVVNVAISIPLAKLYGGIGSAIGTAMALIIGNIIIMNIYYQKTIKINIMKFWKNIFKITVKQIIPLGVIIIMIFVFNSQFKINSLVIVPFYIIIYALYNFKFVFNQYEKDIVISAYKKVFKKGKIKKEGL